MATLISAGRLDRRGATAAAIAAAAVSAVAYLLGPHAGQASVRVWFVQTALVVIAAQVIAILLRRSRAAGLLAVSAARDQHAEVVAAVAERDALSRRLSHQATHDSLTNLPNRHLFLEQLQEALTGSASSQRVSVLFIDLDDFKTVNDTFGHAAGDELLVAVADRLRHALREGDLVARFGGDEFAVLLRDADDDLAGALANRLVGVLHAPFALTTGMASGQASAGLVLATRDLRTSVQEQAAELLRRADLAMYAAKEAGGGRHMEFRDEFDDAIRERRSIQQDITEALIHEDFAVHYQPIVDLRTHRLVSVEALLRWQHPQRGTVPPDVFIPVAESCGAIVELGMLVLAQACADLQRWDETCPDSALHITVNLSARQLQEASVGPQIARVLHRGGVDPRRLTLEVTESLLMDDKEAAANTLWQLRTLGIRIVVDDFGTGYSSLSRLVDLPLDEIKIDRSFVDELRRSEAGATIITAAVAMAHGLGLGVIAEGVENLEQLRFLQGAGCDHAQGFLFSRPLPADDIERMVQQGTLPALSVPPPDSDLEGIRSVRPSPEIIPLHRHR
ncbi:MAG: putative bifunctional diguanylate cyclase/phosphodiesterase [Mycobacteriales bacterium]